MTACAVPQFEPRDGSVLDIPGNHMRECLGCREWVKPVYSSTRRHSSKSNLPGLYGIFKNIACCPKCGEHVK
jgi:hypothetical protein